MSYSACANSALLAPASYPEGSIGYVINPTIDTTATASNTPIDAFDPLELPKGVYQVSGAIRVSSAGVLTELIVRVEIDGSLVTRFIGDVSPASADSLQIPFSYTYSTDGTTDFVVSVQCQTTGAVNYQLVSTNGDSLISIVRIA